MPQRPLVVVLFVTLLGVAAWLTLRAPAMPQLPMPDTAAGANDSEPATAAIGDAANREAGAVDAADARQAAAIDPAAPRPLPTDAAWVEALVVDDATDQPVADANVWWHDEAALKVLARRAGELADEETPREQIAVEEIAAEAGWRTRSDAQGRARVTVREWTRVAASHGNGYGTLSLEGNTVAPRDGYRLRLQPDRTALVRVVDDRGAPAGGVPLALALVDAKESWQRAGGHGAQKPQVRTSPDGTARLPHVQLLAQEAAQLRRQFSMAIEACVAVALPGLEEARATVDLAADAPQAEIRLPPCGSLRVRATLHGAPLPDFRAAMLSYEPNAADEPGQAPQRWIERASARALVGADGFARFAHVPIGRSFDVRATAGARVGGAHRGPTVAGQELEITLTPASATACLVRGRALLAPGQPLAAQALAVATDGQKLRRNRVRTDADGRFVAALGDVAEAVRVPALRLDWKPEDGAMRRGVVRELGLQAGVVELGDVVLGEPPVVVRGRLTRDGKPYTQSCTFVVEHATPRDGKAPVWNRVQELHAHVAEDGAFVVHGDSKPGEHRLNVTSKDANLAAPIPFALGATDVDVALTATQPLAASAQLAEDAPGYQIAGVLVSATPGDLGRDGAPRRIDAQVTPDRQGRTNYRWARVPAGRYTLELRLHSQDAPVHAIPDVVVPAPAGGDPRLADIDLRPFVTVVTLRTTAGDGKDLPEGGVALVGPRPAQSAWRGASLWGPQPKLLLPAGPYDLLVCMRGYRPVPVRGTAATVDLRLEPWPTVALRLVDAPPLPDGVQARARLVGAADPAPDQRWSTPWENGRVPELLQPPAATRAFDKGVARAQIGDGAHTLAVELRRPTKRDAMTVDADGVMRMPTPPTAPVAPIEPATVLPTAAEVAVRAPLAAWQAAIEAIGKAAAAAPATSPTGGR